MALNYGDNYVSKIKKGTTEYLVRDSIAETAINTIQGNASTEGSIAKAQADAQSYADGLASNYDAAGSANAAEQNAKSYADGLASNYDAAGSAAAAETAAKSYADGLASNYDAAGAANTAETAAKTYAKGLVDTILGEDSTSNTLATLKEVIAELNDPANQGGITGTFVDTVKAGLSGLGNTAPVYYTQEEIEAAQEGDDAYGKTTSDIKIPARPVTIKEYVDDAVANSDNAADAIAALDATPSQAAGNDGLALNLTQVDGVVTAISGSIAANTYDAYGAASTAAAGVVGASGDASTANTVYGAKAYADAAVSALGASTITNGVLELAL